MDESRQPDWCYTCGRISARETTALVARSFFENVLATDSLAEAYNVIAQSDLKDVFDGPEDLVDFDARLDRFRDTEILGVVETAPIKSVGAFFVWPEGFAKLRNTLTDMARASASAAEVSEALSTAYGADANLAGLSDVMSLDEFSGVVYDDMGDEGRRTNTLIVDLDRKFLKALVRVAGAFRARAAVAGYIDDFVLAKVAEVFARKIAAGFGADEIAADFATGALADFLGDRAGLRPETPEDAILLFAPESVVDRLKNSSGEIEKFDSERYALVVEEALVEKVKDAGLTAFGLERAFVYLAAIRTQVRNAKLAISAVVNDLDRDETKLRLRREYVA